MIKALLLLILLAIGYPILAATDDGANPDICDEACVAAKSEPVADDQLETGWPGCSENQTPVATLNAKTAVNREFTPETEVPLRPGSSKGTE